MNALKKFKTKTYMFKHLYIAALLIITSWAVPYAQPQEAQEYELKSAVLFKLLKFIAWPEGVIEASNNKYILYVLGDSLVGESLQRYDGKEIEGKTLEIHMVKKIEDIGPCHIVFVCSSERAQLSPIIKTLEERSILTIGDTEGFIQQGGIINLVIKESRIRFEVSVKAAEHASLQISSKLLRLAVIIDE